VTAQTIVVASEQPGLADAVAARLQHDGAVAYATHSAGGCLRVATSVSPDIILLDPRLPARLEHLLHAHPISAHARVLHLSESQLGTRAPANVQPVAA
jgi:DNA-binding response OmpR family regulator